MLGAIVLTTDLLYYLFALLAGGSIVYYFLRVQPLPAAAAPAACPWYQQVYSYGKRHVPLLLLAGGLLLLLFLPRLASTLTFWAHGAPPILPGQQNVDSDQEEASRQAGGIKPLGTILSIFAGGTFLFGAILVGVWFVMHYITPGLPPWAKKYYTLGFKTPLDEGYAMGPNLSTYEQYTVYNRVWLSLCFLWALCVYIAAVSS